MSFRGAVAVPESYSVGELETPGEGVSRVPGAGEIVSADRFLTVDYEAVCGSTVVYIFSPFS